jgi:hypothetical protein
MKHSQNGVSDKEARMLKIRLLISRSGGRATIIAAVALLVVAGVVATIAGKAATSAAIPTGTIPPPTVNVSPVASYAPLPNGLPPTSDPRVNPATGDPAITPTIPNAGPTTPAFSAQDATTFVVAHPPATGRVRTTGAVTVTNVTFETNQSMANTLHENIRVEPERLLCVVQMSGAFTLTGPPGTGASQWTVAYEFFDAHTGNYLGVNLRR